MSTFTLGCAVRHTTQPGWGVGEVVTVDAKKITVRFSVGTKTFNIERVTGLLITTSESPPPSPTAPRSTRGDVDDLRPVTRGRGGEERPDGVEDGASCFEVARYCGLGHERAERLYDAPARGSGAALGRLDDEGPRGRMRDVAS